MYVLAKFQLHILKVAKVTALQGSSNRNKIQALPKTGVTYEWSEVRTLILHHHVCLEPKNGLLDKVFLLLTFITTNKIEIHEETWIANDRFNITWTTANSLAHFNQTKILSSSYLGKLNDTQFLTVGPFLHQEQGRKIIWQIFFSKYAFISYPMCFTEKSLLCY